MILDDGSSGFGHVYDISFEIGRFVQAAYRYVGQQGVELSNANAVNGQRARSMSSKTAYSTFEFE